MNTQKSDEELVEEFCSRVDSYRAGVYSVIKLTNWFENTITTIRQEAEEREAYEWFNRWYNSHVAKLSEEERFSFTHWATNRLQELGVHDEGKEEDAALIRSKIK